MKNLPPSVAAGVDAVTDDDSIRLDLPIILPGVQDEQDACVERLLRLILRQNGVRSAHVVRPGVIDPGHIQAASDETSTPQLCLHYDPERLALSEVIAVAKLAGAGVTARYDHATIRFRLIGAEDDGRRLEDGLRRMHGVTGASVNFAGQVARVEYDTRRTDLATVTAGLRELGAEPEGGRVQRPQATPEGHAPPDRGQHPEATAEGDGPAGWYTRNRELAWSITSGILLTTGWLLGRAGAAPWASIALYIAAYVFGARDNVGHLLKDLRRGHFHFNIDLLMVVAALGAAALGEWAEGALLLFLFSLGHALEHYALGRARNAITALAELAPSRATVVRDGREEEVAIEQVRPGDRVVIKPAERIPVDGTVADGRSSVNQAPITGESVPVEKTAGDEVFAGSVNGDGALVVAVTSAVGDRTLDRVIKLVSEAETQKAPTQQFTDRFERIFVPAVLVADVLLIVIPPMMGFWTWSESFYRAMALLVAASPCALALGTPAAVLAGIAQAARRGVLIKGGAYLETLGTIDVFAMDKTGTITRGEPEVTDIVAEAGVSEERLLAQAAAVERRSQHPLARAIIDAAEQRTLTIPDAGDLESVTGQGVRAPVGDAIVEVGRLKMFEGDASPVPERIRATVERLEQAGRTTMVARRRPAAGATGVEWLGVLGVADQPREGVRETLAELRALGVRQIVMLTGDNAGVGRAIAERVGVDDVRAGLMPEDKVTAIKSLAESGRVAMVGDGVNDAPALAHATVGIAMGGAGTAAALETADVALMGDDLGRLPFAVGLSRRARSVIRQNLFVSLGVIALLVGVTVTGVAGIGIAVIVHEGSTLVVIANALRLLRYNG
jgi:Cd2+/Zn2+-exporting ATPase